VLQNLRPGSSYLRGISHEFGSILALCLSMMINDSDRDRIRELCSLIAVEQDRHKLLQFIEELSLILGARDGGARDGRLKVEEFRN
jgi:hypothetical protein